MLEDVFLIGGKGIGVGQPCFLIAEFAQAHDGSLGFAHAFIDAASKTGVDAIKFQTHIASAESTLAEPWRVKFSLQDVTRYDYWRRVEFKENEWAGLKKHAEEKGLIFLSSPFSTEAVEMLSRIEVPAWKVASGEMNNGPLFEIIIATGKPILVSTGMSPLKEIDLVVDRIRSRNRRFAVMQCTSAYPCPPEKVGLNMIPLFRDRYSCPIGLSDHSGTIYPGLAAAVLGIQVLEVHVTLSREMFGPDVPSSVTTTELKQLVEGVRYIETMMANQVEKDSMLADVDSLRKIFTKSIVARIDLTAGTVIQREHLALKKSGPGGLPPDSIQDLIGCRLTRDVKANEKIRESDFRMER
jgi:N-acetylneuraminate synthase